MSSTKPTPQVTAQPVTHLTIRVLYNDAVVNRQSDTEEALPGRMSETDRETRHLGHIMSAFSRVFTDPYHHGDPLLAVYHETVPTPAMGPVDTPDRATTRWAHSQCERMFALLNTAHPEGFGHRSMSMGDIVIIGESAWVCNAVGFDPVDVAASDIKEA